MIATERDIASAVEQIQLISNAPAESRDELQKAFCLKKGYRFDPERFYRETEENHATAAADVAKAMMVLECEWPEQLSPALRKRLKQQDERAITAWRQEITRQLEQSSL
jgi:hypothetical protein